MRTHLPPRLPPLLPRLARALTSGSLLLAVVIIASVSYANPGSDAPKNADATAAEHAPSAAQHGESTNRSAEPYRHANARAYVESAHRAAEASTPGRAVLYLERARYLRPFDMQIRGGLDLLRHQIQRQRMHSFPHTRLTQGEPTGLWWWRAFHVLPTRLWAIAGLVALWVAFLLWSASRRIHRGVAKDSVRTVSSLSLLLMVVMLAGWIGAARTSQRIEPAVVIAAHPVLFHAPDPLSSPVKSPDLYEGAVVLIRSHSVDWTEIELADKKRIWVHSNTVVPIEPASGRTP